MHEPHADIYSFTEKLRALRLAATLYRLKVLGYHSGMWSSILALKEIDRV
jgi:hypothetical protein